MTREEVALLFAFADGMRAQEDAGAELTVLQRETVRWAALCRRQHEALCWYWVHEGADIFDIYKDETTETATFDALALRDNLKKMQDVIALMPTEGESDGGTD